MDTQSVNFRDVDLAEFDTTAHLKAAAQQAEERNLDDFCIVDVDSHHYESESFAQIIPFIEDPVIRYEATQQGFGQTGIWHPDGSYQQNAGRIIRYKRGKEKAPSTPHRDITLTKRWMDAMAVDIACLFPTPMLLLGIVPRAPVEVALARAYNRWLVETILAAEPRIVSMLYLPFNDPAACYKMVQDFGDKKGVVGFMVSAPHYKGVYDNAYMKTYAAIQELGKPIAFHGAFHWLDQTTQLTNRFIAAHALGFTIFNIVHLTNWIVNGLPERFPKLKVAWIESGVAWIPFVMQRLDNDFMMRSGDAPLLKRRPSEYMAEMFYSSQPMENIENRAALQVTFDMMKAETQLLYASDYPHWDMDPPAAIFDIPFLSEQGKRNILGANACRMFGIEPMLSAPKMARRAARQAARENRPAP